MMVVGPAAAPSPGPCLASVSPDAALLMRYGTVARSRAGRAAAALSTGSGGVMAPCGAAGSTPGTPMCGDAGAFSAAAAAALGSSTQPPGTPGGAATIPPTPGAFSTHATTAGQQQQQQQQQQLAVAAAVPPPLRRPVRRIRFKHVRFNRVAARLTYEGAPLSVSGLGLVLDNCVYRNIDGGWVTVLNR